MVATKYYDINIVVINLINKTKKYNKKPPDITTYRNRK